uniref:Uncharacterized protein n=1 Tax=Rhizophora mucronata TaxID=61149 RepID=A0A2P2PQZ1_RHIMU
MQSTSSTYIQNKFLLG